MNLRVLLKLIRRVQGSQKLFAAGTIIRPLWQLPEVLTEWVVRVNGGMGTLNEGSTALHRSKWRQTSRQPRGIKWAQLSAVSISWKRTVFSSRMSAVKTKERLLSFRPFCDARRGFWCTNPDEPG